MIKSFLKAADYAWGLLPPVAEKRREAAWLKQRQEKRERIQAGMKPDDGQMGYMVDGVSGDYRIVPVNIQRLKKTMSSAKELDAMNYGDQRGGIDPRNFKVVARSITNNNGMCSMIELKIENGEVRLHEGNHRLRALESRGLTDILVVISEHSNKEVNVDEATRIIYERCGTEHASVGRVKGQGEGFVYAFIDYDGPHLTPTHYDVGMRGGYYTIGEPVSKPS